MKIIIKQIHNNDAVYKFRGWSDLTAKYFNEDDYDYSYEYEDDLLDNLEDIYMLFNLTRPSDYMGCSLSVSDLVRVVDGAGKVKNGLYYVDIFGYERVGD